MTDERQLASISNGSPQLAPRAMPRKNSDDSAFSVMVGQVYDGPLDLLLDLIRKQDIDIYDIPIAKITHRVAAHPHQVENAIAARSRRSGR